MYADEIVLVSKSRIEMQIFLERLNVYCNKWLSNVNIDKTNMTICNKNGKMLKEQNSFEYQLPIKYKNRNTII